MSKEYFASKSWNAMWANFILAQVYDNLLAYGLSLILALVFGISAYRLENRIINDTD